MLRRTAIILIAAFTSASAQSPLCTDVQQIEVYRKGIDAALPRFNKRTFAKIGETWREVAKSENDVAVVALQNKQVLRVLLTSADDSGDWLLRSTYYFRPDATLARLSEQLDTVNGNARVVRDTYFDCGGKTLKRNARHMDLNSGNPKRPEADFADHAATVYKRTRDLPFFRLL